MSRRSAAYDRWTEGEILRLIRARIALDHVFTNKVCDQRDSWERVGLEGRLDKPYDKLKKKWYNLIAKYKQIKEPAAGVSTDDDSDLPTPWPFYDVLDDFLSTRHNINPPFVIDTGVAEGSGTPEPQESSLFEIDFDEAESRISFELTALEADELKTNKKIRKLASIFEKYMRERFNITVESSDSE